MRSISHIVFGIDASVVDELDTIFGEVSEKGIVAVLGYVGCELSFELAQEIGALARFVFLGGSSGAYKDHQQKYCDTLVHEAFSGRSSGDDSRR